MLPSRLRVCGNSGPCPLEERLGLRTRGSQEDLYVEWLTWGAPETEDIAVAGGAAIKAARVPVTLTYTTPDPLT